MTAENAGQLGKGKYNTAKLLGGPEIDHYHQAVAVVVAEIGSPHQAMFGFGTTYSFDIPALW